MVASFSFSQTQSEMNKEARENFEKKDKELNITYQKILQDYKDDTAFINNLRISQRIWIQLRDAEMDMKFPEKDRRKYGTVFLLCWYSYEEDLTNERIKFLKTWLDGIEEGDVCNGSVKIKG